ncbi:MAG: TPM domain-containing protein [Bacteroidota bacterium]
MKYKLVLLFLLCTGLAFGQQIPAKPSPPKLVNDFVGILTPDQQSHLEQKLVAYDDSTSVQIVVVIVNTLNDYDPVDYAVKLGREWGVGNKKTNNGVVFLMSMEPGKRKVFIAPGYGLEGAIPDITAKQIVENNIIPQFRQENYYAGINNGIDAIIKASMGEYKAPEGYRDRGNNKGGGGGFIFIIILVVIFLILGRGGGGGKGGGMMSRRGYRGIDALPFLLFPGGGGGSGGGGWSGGGSGGGGFGGFGGGSFGGGGSGGSW